MKSNDSRNSPPEGRPRYQENSSLRSFLKREATNETVTDATSNAEVKPYFYFFHCLADKEKTIEKILEIIVTAEQAKNTAANQYLACSNTRSSSLDSIFTEIHLETEAINQEEIQDIFAGTLFVIANSLLTSMENRIARQYSNRKKISTDKKIGSTSLYKLIRAASNNFRHYEDWGNVQDNHQAAKNIQILKDAGLSGPWDRNMCAEVLEIIGWQSVQEVTKDLKLLASEIFQSQTNIPL